MTDKPDGLGLTADLMLRPEYSTVDGTDKTFFTNPAGKTFQQFGSIGYVVPAGKVLKLTSLGFFNQIEAAANAGLIAHVFVLITVDAAGVLAVGAATGTIAVLPQPIVLTAGQVLLALVVNNCNCSCSLGLVIWGYEKAA